MLEDPCLRRHAGEERRHAFTPGAPRYSVSGCTFFLPAPYGAWPKKNAAPHLTVIEHGATIPPRTHLTDSGSALQLDVFGASSNAVSLNWGQGGL